MKIAIRIVLLTILCLALPASVSAAPSEVSDVSDHWAQQEIHEALAQGWVNGYPDGLFRPDETITRAEYVKMLGAAVRLTPDSEAAGFLMAASGPTDPEALLDMDSHWLTTQGWLGPAMAAGLINPADYSDARFHPDLPVRRQEMAVLAVRALGLAASAEAGSPPPRFTDWEFIPDWAREYVSQAADAGVIAGYPDGTFGPDRTATRAEAVVMVRRAVQWMTYGVDPQIMVFVRRPSSLYPNDAPQPVSLPVSAQEIDGTLYVPARALYGGAAERLYPDAGATFAWNPAQQALNFEYGVPHQFRAGAKTSMFPSGQEQSPPSLPAPARLLFGELMIPVYSASARVPLWVEDPVWKPQAKILIISLHDPSHPLA